MLDVGGARRAVRGTAFDPADVLRAELDVLRALDWKVVGPCADPAAEAPPPAPAPVPAAKRHRIDAGGGGGSSS